MKKLLTISIAAYNAESCITQAIESCLISNDMLDKLEIIVVNDGSKDNTLSVVREYERKYSGIIKVIDKKNGGYGSTVNEAINSANGKYFKLLDADDQYNIDEFQKLVMLLESIDADMILTNYVEIISQCEYPIEYALREGYIKGNIPDIKVVMHAICYKTSILKNMGLTLDEGVFYTDTEFVFEPLFKVKNVYFSPLHVYRYNLGNEGQSVNMKKRVTHINDISVVLNRLVYFYKTNMHLPVYTEKVIKRKLSDIGRFYIYTILHMDKIDRRKLISFEEDIRQLDIEVYDMMKTKCISFLRKTNYRMCRICSLYLKMQER